jgi:hypothetical protein
MMVYFQALIFSQPFLPKSILGAKLKKFPGLMWQCKAFQVPKTNLVS